MRVGEGMNNESFLFEAGNDGLAVRRVRRTEWEVTPL